MIDKIVKEHYNKLFSSLQKLQLNPYLYHVSQWGSYYIKFKDKRLKSVRVGDHDGREKYKYKWNLRKDLIRADVKSDRGVKRFYFPFSQVEGMAYRIRRYYDTILKNERKGVIINNEVF